MFAGQVQDLIDHRLKKWSEPERVAKQECQVYLVKKVLFKDMALSLKFLPAGLGHRAGFQ